MPLIRLASQHATSAAFMISAYAPGDNSQLVEFLSNGSPGLTRWDDFEISELEMLANDKLRSTVAGSELYKQIKSAIEERKLR